MMNCRNWQFTLLHLVVLTLLAETCSAQENGENEERSICQHVVSCSKLVEGKTRECQLIMQQFLANRTEKAKLRKKKRRERLAIKRGRNNGTVENENEEKQKQESNKKNNKGCRKKRELMEEFKGLQLRRRESSRDCLTQKLKNRTAVITALAPPKLEKCKKRVTTYLEWRQKKLDNPNGQTTENENEEGTSSLVKRQARRGRRRGRKNRKKQRKGRNPARKCYRQLRNILRKCRPLKRCCPLVRTCHLEYEVSTLHDDIKGKRLEIDVKKDECRAERRAAKQLRKEMRKKRRNRKNRNKQRRRNNRKKNREE